MKKVLFITLLLFSIQNVFADELDITNDIEVRYKWYKEEIIETYHKKGETLKGYIEDPKRVTYTEDLEWSPEFCKDTIARQQRIVRYYRVLESVRFIVLDNFKYNNNVTILYKGDRYPYEIMYQDEDKIKFKLKNKAEPNNLIFIIDSDTPYNITLTSDHTQLLYKQVKNEKVLTPDSSWMLLNESYQEITRSNSEETGGFVTLMKISVQCGRPEVKTYRYKINKTYYDDEYHSFVEGYLPDYSDYKIYYKGNEIIKEQIKYIKGDNVIKYVKGEDKISYIEKECEPKEIIPQKEIEYKYIDNLKIIEKTPTKIKYILFGLISLVMFFIFICLKMSSKNND